MIVALSKILTFSGSLAMLAKTSVKIVTTIGAFWWVSRRWADKKFTTNFSKMNWLMVDWLWQTQLMNGFDTIFCTAIWNWKTNTITYEAAATGMKHKIIEKRTNRNCGTHLTIKSVNTFCKCASDWKSILSIPPIIRCQILCTACIEINFCCLPISSGNGRM